jgi:hypothetical protein
MGHDDCAYSRRFFESLMFNWLSMLKIAVVVLYTGILGFRLALAAQR